MKTAERRYFLFRFTATVRRFGEVFPFSDIANRENLLYI